MSGGRCRLWGGRRRNQRQFRRNLQACLAYKLRDRGCVEPCGIVLHAQGVSGVVKAEAPYAVDFAGAGQRESHRLGGWCGIAEKDFHNGHRKMIPRGARWRLAGDKPRGS